MWPHPRYLELVGIELPVLQAPMAGSNLAPLASAVSAAGGLGALPCAMLAADKVQAQVLSIRQQTDRPFNVNFFTHTPPEPDETQEASWLARLGSYYEELGLDPANIASGPARAPFDASMLELMLELKPKVISFHFGLPAADLLQPLKDAGIVIQSSATTVAEARWLADHGADAIIAQGAEAGGHRGMFLGTEVSSQVGTMALVPQIVDAVDVPVIAAGGIADARGIVAAMALGASAVQIGTAYLFCPEAETSAIHREALSNASDDKTAITNVMTGRPARGIVNRLIREVGPLSSDAPQFPLAASAVTPLRAAAEANGSGEFSPLWAGQAVALGREVPAAELTRGLANEALALLKRMSYA